MSEQKPPQSPEQPDFPHDLRSTDERTEDQAEQIEALLDFLAEGIANRLTGSSRRRAPSSSEQPADQKGQAKSPEPVTPENFEARTQWKVAGHAESDEEKAEQGFAENRKTVTQRERLDKLLPIAQKVAQALKEKRNQENQRRKALVKDAEKAHRKSPSFDANPYEPELTVEHTWVSRKPKLFSKINRFDSVAKITDQHKTECAQGWLLARTATLMNSQPVVQEVLLDKEGALYAYATDDQRYIESLLSSPLARKQIQDKGQDTTRPWHTQLSTLPLAEEAQYDERTDPTVKNFHKLGEGEYPPPGIGGKGHMFVDPEVIQQGLEDLVLEKFGDHKLG
ncbi:MAG TPA: hypothetical protein VM535_00640 [Candidatus Saccharimonadales bacterium]|nr:hypothetical protein [Candidatus Saccharimonadales bacterium]